MALMPSTPKYKTA